ncbi:MAG: cardiolipin synthase C [Alphaproteobacteria bacterium]|nr:cardiolipin synthase C [Alphaproteobacteria bacterium]
MRAARFGILNILFFTVVAGCGSVPVSTQHPQIPSYALPQSEKTGLGASLKDDIAAHSGQSGFRVLTTGSESFAMRLALIRAAEKSLDLQYFSINDDTTSNLLIEALLQAAQRGVRIRFLLDDFNFDAVDETFSVLDGFKNLEIRVFNPVTTRDHGLLEKAVLNLTDLKTMNHRMHNKALIGDNQMAIIGGRNLGDEYFEENTDVTFRDIDILTAGPVTAAISRSFDQYWNSKDAIPVPQLRKPEIKTELAVNIRNELAGHWEKVRNSEKGGKLLRYTLAERLKDGDVKLTWAWAELVADSPKKIDTDRDETVSPPLMRLDFMLDRAEHEFMAVSPYFVPRESGTIWLAGLARRGLRVKILTNSLASTDVVAVHTGYRRYRETLVRNGVLIYELKPIGGQRPAQRLIGKDAPARASLHAKLYVIDRSQVMIGSFNLDPRSIELNTELALVIYSRDVAAQVIEMFEEATSSVTSYQLAIEPDSGKLVWITKENDRDIRFYNDPSAGFWRRAQTNLMSLLPIEDQL